MHLTYPVELQNSIPVVITHPRLVSRVFRVSSCHYTTHCTIPNTLHNTLGQCTIHYTIPITQYIAQFPLRNTLNNTQCKTHKTHNTQCKTVFRIVGEVFRVATPLSSFNGGHHPSNFFTISIIIIIVIINLVYLTFVPSILSPMQILMGHSYWLFSWQKSKDSICIHW